MSTKLDKSLDELLSTRRRSARRNTGRRSGTAKAATTAVPVGGIKKSTRTAKPGGKGIPTGPSAVSTESKIIVSGLVSSSLLPDTSRGFFFCPFY